MKLATFTDCVPSLLTLKDILSKYWAYQALNVLLSGTKKRDREVECVNKRVMFKADGTRLIHGLVSSLLSENMSDLIIM
jgi:hypothetical protein